MSQTKAQLIDNLVSPITGALGSAAAPTFSFTADLNTGLYSPGADQLAFATGGTGRLFIDSSGRLLVGTSTARSNFFGTTLSSLTQTEGIGGSTARGSLSVINNDVSNNPPYVLLGRSGAATLGSNAAVVSGSRLGTLTFHGADGASFIEAATVAGEVDGTPGSNDMPGRLVFSTTSDNAGSPTERMRLDSSGRLGLGTSGPTANFQVNHTSTAPSLSSFTGSAATFNGTSTIRLSIGTNPAPNYTSWIQSADASGNAYPLLLNPSGGNVGIGTTTVSEKLHVDNGGNDVAIRLSRGAQYGTFGADSTGIGVKSAGADPLYFSVNGTERFRCDSSGRLLVGTTTATYPNPGIGLYPSGYAELGNNAGTAGSGFFGFARSNVLIGSVTQTGTTGVAYNTSSDYRLKENVEPINGAVGRILRLKPSRFNFIADPDRTVDGFIAHEAQAVVPESVHGTKDEVDEAGKPIYQGIDQSKLVPLLTAALQEALQKIEDLEGRLTAAGI